MDEGTPHSLQGSWCSLRVDDRSAHCGPTMKKRDGSKTHRPLQPPLAALPSRYASAALRQSDGSIDAQKLTSLTTAARSCLATETPPAREGDDPEVVCSGWSMARDARRFNCGTEPQTRPVPG